MKQTFVELLLNSGCHSSCRHSFLKQQNPINHADLFLSAAQNHINVLRVDNPPQTPNSLTLRVV